MSAPWYEALGLTTDDAEILALLLDLEAETPSHPVGNPGLWHDIREHLFGLVRFPDPDPSCDICGEAWEDGGEGEDWNGDTGNHRTCEEWSIRAIGDAWHCACGNETHTDGFYPALADGTEVEPTVDGPWDGRLVLCARCGRIMDQTTERDGRVQVVRGPGPVTLRD